jgi:hypothetical protein
MQQLSSSRSVKRTCFSTQSLHSYLARSQLQGGCSSAHRSSALVWCSLQTIVRRFIWLLSVL